MISIKVLGLGCKKCQALEAKVRDLVNKSNINAKVEKVTDIEEMMRYGITMTPGLVINEQVKSYGIISKDEQILDWLLD